MQKSSSWSERVKKIFADEGGLGESGIRVQMDGSAEGGQFVTADHQQISILALAPTEVESGWTLSQSHAGMILSYFRLLLLIQRDDWVLAFAKSNKDALMEGYVLLDIIYQFFDVRQLWNQPHQLRQRTAPQIAHQETNRSQDDYLNWNRHQPFQKVPKCLQGGLSRLARKNGRRA